MCVCRSVSVCVCLWSEGGGVVVKKSDITDLSDIWAMFS